MTLSSDGRMLAWWAEYKSGVHVWNTAAWAMAGPALPAPTAESLAFSSDGDSLAVAGYDRDKNTGLVSVWDYRTGREIVALRGHTSAVACTAFSPDGGRLATGSADQAVMIWDLATGKELFTFRGHVGAVSALAFSPDGTRLASGSHDGAVRIWDVRPFDERTD